MKRATTHTPRTRDAALRKLKSVNRWVFAASAGLTGIFTAVAANAFPGHTVKTGSAAREGSSSTSRSSRLRPPASAPQSGEESGTEAEGSAQPQEGGESAAPSESAPPTESTTPGESSTPSESTSPSQESGEAGSQPSEPEPPAESAPPAETEAPVVSGGS